MNDKQRTAILFIACFLAALLFSTNSFSRQPYTPFKVSIGMEADKNNHNSIRVTISAFCSQPFKNGEVLLIVPAIGTNPEHTTVIWSGDSPSSFDRKFENIFDLPKGVYRFAACFGGVLSKSGRKDGEVKYLYVEVGDTETVWSTNSAADIEREKILIELKKRGITFKKGVPIDQQDIPEDLKRRIIESVTTPSKTNIVETNPKGDNGN
jgi:lambda repressor-like predicted transcriptional regulator